MDITVREDGAGRFKEYPADEFPKFRPGEIYAEQNIVLGNFPACSSSIQKDFGDIIAGGKINVLLNDLLANAGESGRYSDPFPDEPQERTQEISERDLVYINDLNSSQESVLSAIGTSDELVMHGPPEQGNRRRSRA